MALIVKATGGKGGDFSPAPAGNHVAVAILLADLGTQETLYGPKPQIRIAFELVGEQKSNGDNFIVANEYTPSLSEKATLRKHLEAWRNKPFTKEELAGFDLKNILGKPCMVQLIHKTSKRGSQYAVIANISSLPKGMPVGKVNTALLHYEIEMGTGGTFDQLPEFIQNKVKASVEFSPADEVPMTEAEIDTSDEDPNDALPF